MVVALISRSVNRIIYFHYAVGRIIIKYLDVVNICLIKK
jgi:hypothetical protein